MRLERVRRGATSIDEGRTARRIPGGDVERALEMQLARFAARVESTLSVVTAVPVPKTIRDAAFVRRDVLRLEQRETFADRVRRARIDQEGLARLHRHEVHERVERALRSDAGFDL